MNKERKYKLERRGTLEYVLVQCPHGHLSCGQKVGDVELVHTLVCTNPNCSAQWRELVPTVLGLEAAQ